MAGSHHLGKPAEKKPIERPSEQSKSGESAGLPAGLRIGTRGSPPALAQAAEGKARLIAAYPDPLAPIAIGIVFIQTTGDQGQDPPLAWIFGKGLFSQE